MNRIGVKSDLVYYKAAKEFVEISFAAAVENQLNQLVPLHLERTAEWLVKLCPEVDEALLIAGISHDIERAFREEVVYQKMFHSDNGFLDDTFLDYHQQRSAKIIADFLLTLGCPTVLSEKVFHLVSHHEIGGDFESNLLKDADSLSFFQTNVDFFVTVKVKESSLEKVRNKFKWMFERITMLEAREYCRPQYEEAMARLEQLGN